MKNPRWSPWELLCPTATEVEPLYAYDGSGNVRSFDVWSAGGSSPSLQHTYDGLNRLTALYDELELCRLYTFTVELAMENGE